MANWKLLEDPTVDVAVARVYRWLLQWPEAIAFRTLINPAEISGGTGLTVNAAVRAMQELAETGELVIEATRDDGQMWILVRSTSEQNRMPEPAVVRPTLPPAQRRAVPLGLRWKILERDGHRCRSCGATADDAKLVIDHIKPFSKGGPTTERNLQTLCHDCNAGKFNKEPTP